VAELCWRVIKMIRMLARRAGWCAEASRRVEWADDVRDV